jgi:O-antigen/teichoic acid export membrane protein
MDRAGAADSALGPTLLLMAGRSLALAATFLTPVVLARVFDPADFGTYKQLFLLHATLYAVAQAGMAESLYYFLPGAGAAAGRYAANAVLFLGAVGILAGGLLAAAGAVLAGWLHNDALAAHAGPLAAFLGLTLGSAALEIVMIARRRYLAASVCYGASDVLRAACLVLPALWLPQLDAVLAGAVLFAVLRVAATGSYLAGTFGAGLRPDRARLAGQLAYAGPFGAAVLLEIAQASLPQYAVAFWFDAATFAVFAVGCLQVPLVDLVATSAGNVLMVRAAEAARAGRRDRVLAAWHDTTRQLALVFFPLVAGLLVVAPDLVVLLFTEQYRASVPVFRLSIAVVALAALATDAVLRAHARTGFLLALNAVRLGLVTALIAPLVGLLGLPGAILVTVVATVAAKALALRRIQRLLRVGLDRLLPWRYLGAAAAAAILAALAGLAARALAGGPPLAGLLAAGLATAGVYAALLGPLDLLDAETRAALAGWRTRWLAGRPAALRSGG